MDPGGDQHGLVESVRDAFYMIGEMLGIYIVCLWKLERDRSNFEDKLFIQNLRVQVAYAIDLILDPTNAQLGRAHALADWTDRLQKELYDYESDDAFDGGKDLQD